MLGESAKRTGPWSDTLLVCPKRWALAIACRSACGFQSLYVNVRYRLQKISEYKLCCLNKEIDSPVIDNYSISRCQIYTQATSSSRKKKAEKNRPLGHGPAQTGVLRLLLEAHRAQYRMSYCMSRPSWGIALCKTFFTTYRKMTMCCTVCINILTG